MTRLFFWSLVAISTVSFAATWSFEEKSPQEMNPCEVLAFKYSMSLIQKKSTGTLESEILENFRGILSDIKQAQREGKLTLEVLQNSADVNLSLMMYRSYAQAYENQEILQGLKVIESQFPELLADVCSR